MSRPYDIVLIPFPFTDLSSQKIRPALLLTSSKTADVILCMISTKKHSAFDIKITPTNKNGLKHISYARSNKIATIDKKLVLAKLGALESKQQQKVKNKLQKIFAL